MDGNAIYPMMCLLETIFLFVLFPKRQLVNAINILFAARLVHLRDIPIAHC